jgi:Hypothetical glycosyl hydrolase family 15
MVARNKTDTGIGGTRSRRQLAVAAGVLLAATAAAAFLIRNLEADEGPPTARLAWFYSAPVDGTDAGGVAEIADEVVLTGGSDVSFREKLRAEGYSGRVLQYVDLPYARGSTDPNDATFTPWDNQVAWETGDFASLIHPRETWFLHGPTGQRCSERVDPNGVKYLMNPISPGWRSFVVERLRWALTNWGYDGIFLDNLWRAPVAKLTGVCGGTPREVASDAAWRRASAELVRALRRLGYPVWANTDGPGVYGRHLDGWMFEAFAGSWNGGYQSEQDTLEVLTLAERDTREGKDVILVAQGGRDDVARVRYSLGAYLLVAGPTVSFRYSSVDGRAYESLWSYPEYELSLGNPDGPRQFVSGSLWRRRFEDGYVEVDFATRATRIVRFAD